MHSQEAETTTLALLATLRSAIKHRDLQAQKLASDLSLPESELERWLKDRDIRLQDYLRLNFLILPGLAKPTGEVAVSAQGGEVRYKRDTTDHVNEIDEIYDPTPEQINQTLDFFHRVLPKLLESNTLDNKAKELWRQKFRGHFD